MKLSLVVLIVSVMIFKPVYFIVFIALCYWEHVFFLIFTLNLIRNAKNYYSLKILYIDISSLSAAEIWIECCKQRAFKKLYILLMKKKKIKISNILITFMIIFFGIPYNFLKLTFYFLKSDENFRKSLEILYFKEYYLLKNLKIEVLNEKIYLNCFTVGKFVRNFKNADIDQKKFIETFGDLKNMIKGDLEYSSKKFIPLNLTQGYDEKGNTLFHPHYAYVNNKNSFHATSNSPKGIPYGEKKVSNLNGFTQWIESPMSSAIKPGSKNPSTVVSSNVSNFKKSDKKIWVLEKEVNTIKYWNNEYFEVKPEIFNEINKRNENMGKILKSNLGDLYDKINHNFEKDLIIGNYDFIISLYSISEISNLYKEL